ncbi:hypothetical protein BDV93DRAFT_604097 [Ceratobasidium sp. AG-I]|nr:hypothetical protein BDV93DRAFT_604097 [Ceratobasidium sp. AG-I]
MVTKPRNPPGRRPPARKPSVPAAKAAPSPTTEDTSNPTIEEPSKPAVEETSRSVVKETSQPVVEETSKPAAKDTARPAAKDTSKPAAKDTAKPAAKATSKPAAEEPSGSSTRSTTARASNNTSRSKQDPVIEILILGPRGCGKSSLINAVCGEKLQETSSGPELCTKVFSGHALTLGKREFKLFDSPGFDNTHLNDCDLFSKLMQYLLPHGRRGLVPRELTGILYLHPEGDNLGSSTLRRNLHTLKSLLGEQYLARLTIVVIPSSPNTPDRDALARYVLQQKSPFFELCTGGAKFKISSLDTNSIRDILYTYILQKPELFNAQLAVARGELTDLKFLIEEYLERTENKSIESRVAKARPSQEEARNTKRALVESASECKKLALAVEESKTEANKLYADLQRTRAEYASLRSQLQAKENIEQSHIVQGLSDLNRQAENLSRAVSAYLVDTYPKAGITSAKAFQLPELKKLFEHVEGKSSLVLSSTGVGMPTEDFFDLAIRAILSEQLYKRIFGPFHPRVGLSTGQNSFTDKMYKRVRRQQPQAVAGRWRTDLFKAISQEEGSTTTHEFKAEVAERIMVDNIGPLLKGFFHPSMNATLTKQHIQLLNEVVSMACDWNEFLKGGIVLLGDFQPVAYRHNVAFKQELMQVFEPKRGGQEPEAILSTIALGLHLFRARGEDQEPEKVPLCKALIASDSVFALDS